VDVVQLCLHRTSWLVIAGIVAAPVGPVATAVAAGR
jgi:hypothetical protein